MVLVLRFLAMIVKITVPPNAGAAISTVFVTLISDDKADETGTGVTVCVLLAELLSGCSAELIVAVFA